MWSHYAKHHTGVCIEYMFNDVPYLSQFLYPIIYDNSFFDWTPYMDNHEKAYLAKIVATIHKAQDWEYEKEWRLLCGREDNVNTFRDSLPKIKPSCICLGSKIDFKSEFLNKIKNEVQVQKIPVYRMVLSSTEFRMERERIF